MKKKALITGISGQDGYFLTKLLLEKDYEVHGLLRRNSRNDIGNLNDLNDADKALLILHWGDIIDHTYVEKLIRTYQYDEVYHLAAQSFVGLSFTNPRATYDINISGTLNVINAIKEFSPHTKLYFAATSELYGKVHEVPQNEETPFHPRSPYGVSKLAGFWTIKNYRESYNLFMSNGILFNHESEMRGPEFVTRKISIGISKIKNGSAECIELGNLDAKRDWGYAKDYVLGMWQIMQYEKADDFVLAMGKNHSIREFVELGFEVIGKEIVWEGEGVNEIGKDKISGEVLVKVNPEFFRPAEVDELLGDATKAKEKLNWQPQTSFSELVEIMVKHDLEKNK
ncbi:MAG: GDP-mannose 4,6-dehydratase [Patescibacteria group bacterium]